MLFVLELFDLPSYEFNKLYTQSGKSKNVYLTQHGDNAKTIQFGTPKPICPTSWLIKFSAIRSVFANYSHVLDAL